ncbi:NAD(P)/FAD-dependent oxidoreductase [Halobaculum gomorrense]|uniref:Glycine/D-amino acid oxidase n=1 Tax=Halobaculum gomorrense TaxID=43928 RepID=A0A1M5KV05_9EURY|nr:FAD-dependent oxidoreductase [Halobaculum gomorrense]SHG56566.1 Glycine/D-amino acid oxidase [Halobaculum gomorrense]
MGGTDPDAGTGSAAGAAGDGLRVAVVGGGAVGVTAAHDLARAGADVTLFERGDLASGASGRAAGVLYDAYAEDIDAEVGARALERFRRLSGTGEFSFTDCPYVLLARDGDGDLAEAIEGAAERMRVHGRDVETLGGEELRGRFPSLRVDDVTVAAVARNAGWADPGSYVAAVADLAESAGVEIRTDSPVAVSTAPPGVAVASEAPVTRRFDAVVVAAGAHTKQVLADAGIAVPLKPYRVQALVSSREYGGPMWYDASAGAYARPHPAGLLAGDGTVPVEADPDEWDRDADDWFVEDVGGTLRERAGHDPEVDRAWAGLCTATPDGDPLLGAVADGVFVAAGWQGHGFMRAPATGEAVARQVLGESDGTPQFDPTRFDGDEAFEISEGMAVDTESDTDAGTDDRTETRN